MCAQMATQQFSEDMRNSWTPLKAMEPWSLRALTEQGINMAVDVNVRGQDGVTSAGGGFFVLVSAL
jgi:hypothetical protein